MDLWCLAHVLFCMWERKLRKIYNPTYENHISTIKTIEELATKSGRLHLQFCLQLIKTIKIDSFSV